MDTTPGRGPSAGRTLGHYRLIERIGAGGMGEVWRARDERLERDVALKLLLPGTLADEAARKRFRREALALSKLDHPNIATVFDFNTHESADFLVMEYVAGPVVAERLAEGPLPEAEVARLGVQLAEGLAAAHAQGIIHRDLKPANVRLTSDGRLKILDFGLAKLVRPTEGRSLTESLTEAQALVGTLAYVAPEQVRGEAVDARSDLWSAGLVLYELATGARAYAEEGNAQVLYAILNQTPAAPRSLNGRVSAGLEAIILKCLEREPGERYQAATELAADLQRLLGGVMVEAERRRVQARRVRTLSIAAPVAVVLALAALTALNVGGLRTRMFAPPPIRSIAVLPLTNLSGDASQEYFADGMTEALINALGQVSALRVISRTSAMAYKGAKKPLKQIARELGVDAIVEGSVTRSGERVKISAQLIRVKKEQLLWATAFERDLKDVLELQGALAGAVAQKVQAVLAPQERRRLLSTRKVHPQAYDACLRGWTALDELSVPGWRRAVQYFKRAIELDPGYAPSYAGLAKAYTNLGDYEGTPDESMARIRTAIEKALSLDPNLADAHTLLGVYKRDWEFDWQGAVSEFRRALELNPNSAEARLQFSICLRCLGRYEEDRVEVRKGRAVDPLNRHMAAQAGWPEYFARRFTEAEREFRTVLATDSLLPQAVFGLGLALEQQQRLGEAVTELGRACELIPYPTYACALGHAYAVAGRTREARALLDSLLLSPKLAVGGADVAVVYLALGDRKRALEWINRGVKDRLGLVSFLKVDPRLDALHGDPVFEAALRDMGLADDRPR
jgi:serine/threonine-protein kinase